ncbi:MAG: beta-1,6-N-acetylglucosaminyltransferase [Bacteroidota bacterium]
MKTHAYLIMVHNEPEALKLLLSVLDDARNKIYIHIDAKSTSIQPEKVSDHCQKASIQFVSSKKMYWAGYSMIDVTLDLLEASIKDKNVYYHLISGADLPLKSQDELHAFFAENEGKEFVSGGKIVNWKIASRYKYYYNEKWAKYLKRKTHRIARYLSAALQTILLVNRTRKLNMDFYMGGNWFSITHDFAAYVLARKDFIKKYFDHTFCADEVYIPTLLYNSRFKENVSKKMNLRYVDWKRGNPYIWQEKDYEELTSKDLYFARKFSYENHPEIMEKLKKKLLSSDEKG